MISSLLESQETALDVAGVNGRRSPTPEIAAKISPTLKILPLLKSQMRMSCNCNAAGFYQKDQGILTAHAPTVLRSSASCRGSAEVGSDSSPRPRAAQSSLQLLCRAPTTHPVCREVDPDMRALQSTAVQCLAVVPQQRSSNNFTEGFWPPWELQS